MKQFVLARYYTFTPLFQSPIMIRLSVTALTVYLAYLFPVQAARTPKIGFEIETSQMHFYNIKCTESANTAMKGHQVSGQIGGGWFLGVDTTPAKASLLQPEYDVLCNLDDTNKLESLIGHVVQSMVSTCIFKNL